MPFSSGATRDRERSHILELAEQARSRAASTVENRPVEVDDPPQEDVSAEVDEQPEESGVAVAVHTGSGWYSLEPESDGVDRVRGEENIPAGYEIVDEE